jgi:hypothetical protein
MSDSEKRGIEKREQKRVGRRFEPRPSCMNPYTRLLWAILANYSTMVHIILFLHLVGSCLLHHGLGYKDDLIPGFGL